MRRMMLMTHPDGSQRLFPSGLTLMAPLLLHQFNVLAQRPADPARRVAETGTAARL
jgi:hypothetical protein